jgi:hypothetical protein
VALALDFYGRTPKAVKLNGDHDDAVVDMNFGDKRAIVHASYKSESRRDVTFMRDRRTIYRWNVMDMDLKTDNPLIEECKDFMKYLQYDVEPKASASLGMKVVKLVGGMLP